MLWVKIFHNLLQRFKDVERSIRRPLRQDQGTPTARRNRTWQDFTLSSTVEENQVFKLRPHTEEVKALGRVVIFDNTLITPIKIYVYK
jgi:hypothetical protein